MDKKDNIIDRSSYFENVQKTIKARNEFLKEHPELEDFQKEIEDALRKADTWKNKAAVLKTMMDERMWELKKALLELQKSVYKTNSTKED